MALNQRTHNQPSHETQVRGGRYSHSGVESQGSHTPPGREEATKADQHSHSVAPAEK